MGRAGRPKLLQKDGHHQHDGYSRWHPVGQAHYPDLHTDLQKSEDVVEVVPTEETTSSGPALAIYNLVMNLEKMEYGKALLFELQNTIQTLMQNRKLQEDARLKREERNEQSAIGGEDAEDREPNTYGLP
jgi:hypothetical protein|tara:strand:- start:2776 stop:3165 length:390 start_codon:yes stop_codon:yes gene_type:complete